MVNASDIVTSGTVNSTINIIIVIMTVLILVGAFLLWRYFKTFNVKVEIRRRLGKGSGYVNETGFKGRYTFKTSSDKEKVAVFQILGARARKLEFNGDAPDERFKIFETDKKGRVSVKVVFEPDSENQLHPVYYKESKNPETGAVELEAEISRADLQFAATAIKEINDKYTEKAFMEKYGFIIMMVLFLLTAAMYWFASKNYTESAAQMAGANQALANAFSAWVNTVGNNATASGGVGQLIAVG